MVLTIEHDQAPTALWVLPVGDVGGVARHAVDVARVGIPGWRLAVVLPDGPAVDLLRGTTADVVVAPIGPGHGLRRSLAAFRSVLGRVRPDLVHTHLAYADLVGALGTSRSLPLVTTEHGIADDDLVYHRSRARSEVRGRLHQARLRRADAFVAVSEATLDVARRKWRLPPSLPQHVIPNGVDPVPTPASPRAGLHVVSMARLAPEKRIHDLLAGFAQVVRQHPDAHLTVAGDGPLREELTQRAQVLGIGHRVSFPGFVAPDDLLPRADVVAQLSVWENCSYSLLDALARGLGVVASPVGGNPELLPRHCLVDPADRAAVAEALVVQGTDLTARPSLAPGWPDVAATAARIGEVYAEVSSARTGGGRTARRTSEVAR